MGYEIAGRYDQLAADRDDSSSEIRTVPDDMMAGAFGKSPSFFRHADDLLPLIC